MPTFCTPQTVHLLPEIIEQTAVFADAVTSTVNYCDSNQTVKQWIRDDHFVSKLDDEAVKFVFEAPRLGRLAGKKQAVYLETLQRHKIFK